MSWLRFSYRALGGSARSMMVTVDPGADEAVRFSFLRERRGTRLCDHECAGARSTRGVPSPKARDLINDLAGGLRGDGADRTGSNAGSRHWRRETQILVDFGRCGDGGTRIRGRHSRCSMAMAGGQPFDMVNLGFLWSCSRDWRHMQPKGSRRISVGLRHKSCRKRGLDLPEPLRPVTTINFSRGRIRLRFLRLCKTRTVIIIESLAICCQIFAIIQKQLIVTDQGGFPRRKAPGFRWHSGC